MIETTFAPSGSVFRDLLVCFHIKEATQQYVDVPPPVSLMYFDINSLPALVVFMVGRIHQVITIGYLAKKISHAV